MTDKKRIGDYIDYDFHTPNTKEVREFLKKEFVVCEYPQLSRRNNDEFITPSGESNFIFTTNTDWGKFIPTEDFKQLIGMTKKEENVVDKAFTKAHLKDGMIVTTRNGNVYTVTGDRLLREGGMYLLLEDINDDLTSVLEDIRSLDIISVQRTEVLFDRQSEYKRRIAKELEFAEAKRERLNAHIERLKANLGD